nr:SMI1/KNR4 family protein [Pseudomonas bijieensis]
MTDNSFRIPTDTEIAGAESKLNFRFPDQYVQFLKGGSDVANAVFEPAVIVGEAAAIWTFSKLLKPLGHRASPGLVAFH